MRLQRIPRGVFIGLAASLVTWLLLGLLLPGDQRVAAQGDVTPTPIGGEEEEETPTATLPATPLPSLDLRITSEFTADGDLDGDNVVDPGEAVIFTIIVANTGDHAVGPLEVALLYDANFIGAVTLLAEGGSLDAGSVSWTVEQLEAGQTEVFSAAATLNRRFPPGRTLVQASAVARVDGVEIARSGATPVEVAGPNVRFSNFSIDLVTDAAGNGSIDPGDTIRFTIGYSNVGGGPSQEASIVANYPDELTQTIVSNPANAEDIEGLLVWQIGSVPADGQERTVEFTVKLADEFPAGVTTYDLALSLRGATSTLDQRVESVPIAGASLLVTPRVEIVTDTDADGLVDPGDTVLTTLQIANVGTEPATNVIVTATYIPDLFEISGVGASGSDDPATGALTWTIAQIEAGANQVVDFQSRLRTLPAPGTSVVVVVSAESDQTVSSLREVAIPVDAPTPTSPAGPTGTPSVSETRPAQGQGILGAYAVAFLIGTFLVLTILAIVYVASRVLPGTAEERADIETPEERTDHRQMVRELVEGIILTAILFSVMVLGLQNALDQDSVNSIIAGIVGYVAGRVASSR